MARNDFKVVTPSSQLISTRFIVSLGAMATTGGYRGEPFVSYLATAAQTGIVVCAADGSGVIGTTAATNGRFAGLAKADSTQTAAAAGYVTVWMPLPGIIYSGKPKVAGAVNTAAEIDALRGAAVVFDLTSSTYTIDTAATDAAANAIVIVDGDAKNDTVYWYVKPTWSFLGNISTLS
jgi:hypothetical protein